MWDGINLVQLQWLFVAGAGLVIGTLALVLGQRAFRRPEPPPEESPTTKSQTDDAKRDPFRFGSSGDKRRAYRRKGRCVEVDLTDAGVQQSPAHGLVVDRSIKGIRVSVETDIPVGSVLNVRVANMKPPMPWMEVTVVHSKPASQGFEIGCEFVATPTWNILMMFG